MDMYQVAIVACLASTLLGNGSAGSSTGLAGSRDGVLQAVQKLDDAAEIAKSTRGELASAKAELDAAQQAKNAAEAEKHRAMKKRHDADSKLMDLSRVQRDEEGKTAEYLGEVAALQRSISALNAEATRLDHLREQLRNDAKDAGLKQWLENKGRDVLPKTTYGILHKSVDLVDPMAGKIHRLHIEKKRSPPSFVQDLLVYLLVLAPSVVIIATAMRVISRLAQLTPNHCVFIGSIFFAVQALLVFTLSVAFRSEAMTLLQWRHNRYLSALLLLWSVGYITYVGYVAARVANSRDPNGVFQVLGAVFVGYHFYGEAFRPAVLDEELNIRSSAYLIYATVFVLVAYDSSKNFPGAPFKNLPNVIRSYFDITGRRKSSSQRRRSQQRVSV